MSAKRPPRKPPVFKPFIRRFTDERARDLADTIALYNRVRTAHRASVWSKPQTAEVLVGLVIDHVALAEDSPCFDAIGHFLRELIGQEVAIFTGPEIDWSRAVLSLKERVDLRRYLRAQEHFLANDDRIADLLATALCALTADVVAAAPNPPDASRKSTFTVPLSALLREPTALVTRIIGSMLAERMQDAGLFTAVSRRIYENLCAVSGLVPDEEHRKPFLMPDKAELPGAELVDTYLGGTPFAALLRTQVPFTIPRKTFASHGIILAPPNHGKTQLLAAICHDFLQEEDPPGMVVLDPHNDLVRRIEKLDVFHPDHGRLRDRLIILDPADPAGPPALNFLDLGTQVVDAATYETFNYLMSSLSSELTTKQGTAVAYILMLLRAIPGSTIDTLRQIMEDKSKTIDRSKYGSVIRTLDPLVQDFFENQFFSQQMSETRQQISRRLYKVLANDTFRRMFSAPRNAFDAYDAMQQKKIVLISGARNTLRAEGSSVFLRFIVAQFLSAAFRRDAIPEDQRHLCVLLVDEAHHIFDHQTEAILTECRKFGLGFLAATQLVEQMEQSVKAAIYGATAIKIAGPVSHLDAQALGREMYCSGDFIRSMRAIEREQAEFAVFVRGLTDQALRITVPYGTLESAPQLDHAAWVRLRERNRTRVNAPIIPPSRLEPLPEPPTTPKLW